MEGITYWKKYFEKNSKRKPREQLVRAVSFCKSTGDALDLGSGTLIESRFLLASGFKKVIAIDSSPDAKKFANNLNNKKLEFKNISFEEYDFPEKTFDLINAQFSLHLYGKKNFNFFIKRIVRSLKPNGIFVGQFLGTKDSWATDPSRGDYVFHTKKQALGLLSKLKILEFIEEDEKGKTISGDLKHWHIFYFIGQKEV